MATIAERMKEALSFRGMKQSELVKLTGIGKSSISTYLSGEYEPKQRNIYKIAQALNVSEAWLMGYDVPSSAESIPNGFNPLGRYAQSFSESNENCKTRKFDASFYFTQINNCYIHPLG